MPPRVAGVLQLRRGCFAPQCRPIGLKQKSFGLRLWLVGSFGSLLGQIFPVAFADAMQHATGGIENQFIPWRKIGPRTLIGYQTHRSCGQGSLDSVIAAMVGSKSMVLAIALVEVPAGIRPGAHMMQGTR